MKSVKLTKLTVSHLAMMAAMVTGANTASAFMVDSSQQKVVVRTINNVPTQVISQPVYVHANPVAVQNAPASYQQTAYYGEYSEPTPSYATTPAPAPQLTQTQTKQVVASGSAATQYQTTQNPTNFSSQTSYAQPSYNSAFDRLAVSTRASAVVVYDLQTGQPIYEKNVDATRSIASISKVMTAMVVLDAELDMREELTLIASDLKGAKVASTNLKAGDRLTRSEFVLLALMKSENPAAKILARTYPGGYDAFISAMNAKARSLGMYQTRFSDSSGLDPRNVSSANDLVKMMQAVNQDPRYQLVRNFSTSPSYEFYITNHQSGNRTYRANNTNRLVRNGSYPISVQKTGFIREAGYCVVMETNVNNRPAIIVLLGGGDSNARWNDAENILTELAYRY